MRLYHRFTALSLCLVLFLAATTNAQIVGYWNFDDNTADQSGNGNDGTIQGGVTYDADVPAVLGGGKSAKFDGTAGTLVNFAQNAMLPITTQPEFSISMWVKGDGTSGDNNDDRVFSEGMTTDNNPLFNLGTKNDGADATLDVYVRNGAAFGHVFSNGDVFDNTWRHIAWVDTNKVGTLYIDGVQDSVFDYSAIADFTPDTTTIGGILRATDCCNFTGNIDETAIYNIALTAGQVQSLAAGADPLSIPEPSSLTLALLSWVGLTSFRRRR